MVQKMLGSEIKMVHAETARTPPPKSAVRIKIMLDTVFVFAALAFFMLAVTYVWGCEKL